MPLANSESPEETFNNISHQPAQSHKHRQYRRTSNGQIYEDGQKDDAAGKIQRTACVLCRKRKLRCDGARPTCGTCKRLSHDCAYNEVRKKSGPKRGYIKLLEARLHQVETLLKNQELTDHNEDASRRHSPTADISEITQQASPNTCHILSPTDKVPTSFSDSRSPGFGTFPTNDPENANVNAGEDDFPWEMIGLNLEEPLPPQDVIDNLYDLFFTKIYPSLPFIHRPRFIADGTFVPVCLRYIMWTLAASVTDKYDTSQEDFYQRARKYAEADEMKGHGESTTTLAHCQTWILMATYELKQMYFPRAWLSTGKAARFVQMLQLHRLDGTGNGKQRLPSNGEWTECEERRRTFWMAFCIDQYASVAAGWPMTINERDISTNLPSSEKAFEESEPMQTGSLEQAMAPGKSANLQALGGIVLTAALLGRNFLHSHQPSSDDHEDNVDGGFWTRHRAIETILLNTASNLPDHLRLPSGLPDPNIIFLNMSLHAVAICLHQAAIFRAEKQSLPVSVSNDSKILCVTAAVEIASIMRMIGHMELIAMNPFSSFCVYVAARVFVQYLKTRPKDQQIDSSLIFLLQAMNSLGRKNPLTQSFLAQLDFDIESAGLLGLQERAYPLPNPSEPVNICLDGSEQPCSKNVNSQSSGGSISLSASYPPGQQDNVRSLQHLASPKARSDQPPSPRTNAATNTQFLSVSDDMFSTIMSTPPMTNDDILNSGPLAGNDCDMSAMDIALTPMSEGSWNRMLRDADNLLVNVDPSKIN